MTGDVLKATVQWYPPPMALPRVLNWTATTATTTNGTNPQDWLITTGGSTLTTGGDLYIYGGTDNGTIALHAGAGAWTTGPSTTDNCWSAWVGEQVQYLNTRAWNGWVNQQNARIEVRENEAQRRARLAVEEQAMREYRAAEELRRKTTAEADRKAKLLLVENISPAQRKTLKDHGYFDVQVKGKTYRIKWGSHGNVFLVHQDREVVSYCIQPPGVPAGDAMLAQKLLLETDEASFLRIANARQLQ